MKCPYSDCRKDYNDVDWSRVSEDWINPNDYVGSQEQRGTADRIFLISRRCRFCKRVFHEIYIGKENFVEGSRFATSVTRDLLVTYPVSKTKFESKNVPKKVLDAFNEAERCRAVGSLTGAGGCLRKTIYTLCDIQGVSGADYKEKIGKLPVKDDYRELLKQMKWLGDNTTKPGEEKYTMAMVDAALEILPVLVDDIYLKDEKTKEVSKLLAKARSVSKVT